MPLFIQNFSFSGKPLQSNQTGQNLIIEGLLNPTNAMHSWKETADQNVIFHAY